MAFKTVRDLEEWLSLGGGEGERLVGRDWYVFVDVGGYIRAQHPSNPEMGVAFCPIADEEDV